MNQLFFGNKKNRLIVKTLIIAEEGVNHNGDIEIEKKVNCCRLDTNDIPTNSNSLTNESFKKSK